MKTEPNDNAFPIVESKEAQSLELGLTKREYFAAMAMQGLASKTGWSAMEVAIGSVDIADLLIKELNKKEDENPR